MMREKSLTRIYNEVVPSGFLLREVKADIYFPPGKDSGEVSLLLINDGQDLITMHFEEILESLYEQGAIRPLVCVGIHCGEDRRNEYGTVGERDYKGRGAKAGQYEKFIFQELLPTLDQHLDDYRITDLSFCGFSLGGLSALDIVWRNPGTFRRVGVFSGSLWWRSIAQDHPDFVEEEHRIMHNRIREGDFAPHLRFFFETGTLDETADRNNNGIIDSIDDTLSLINELIQKGYSAEDIRYVELKDGRHDVKTWGRAFPLFLKWGWGQSAL